MLTTTSTTVRTPYACNPIDSEACFHGGKCLQTTYGYRCICNAGYTGSFCELSKFDNKFLFYLFLQFMPFAFLFKDINECESNPCKPF